MVAGVVSSCLAPWFDTQMPSTPCFTEARASSTVITPFTTIFIVVFFLCVKVCSGVVGGGKVYVRLEID